MRTYVCSECGYSRTSAREVVEHIDDKHGQSPLAQVKSYEADEDEVPTSALWAILDRLKRRLFE